MSVLLVVCKHLSGGFYSLEMSSSNSPCLGKTKSLMPTATEVNLTLSGRGRLVFDVQIVPFCTIKACRADARLASCLDSESEAPPEEADWLAWQSSRFTHQVSEHISEDPEEKWSLPREVLSLLWDVSLGAR